MSKKKSNDSVAQPTNGKVKSSFTFHEVDELPESVRTSKYEELISAASELRAGKYLEVDTNGNLASVRNSLFTVTKRREALGLKVRSRSGRLFLEKVA